MSLVSVGLGYPNLRQGEIAEAIPPLEKAVNLCRTFAISILVPWCATTLGLAYAQTGRFDEAISLLQEGIKSGNDLRLTRFQPLRVSMLANAYHLMGEKEKALATAKTALDLAVRYQEKGPEAWALYFIAESNNSMPTAEHENLVALDKAQTLGMRPLAAHCHLGLGKLYAKIKQPNQAREEVSRAVAMYEEMGMTFYLNQARRAV